MKKRLTEEQIIGFLQEADAGVSVKELGRKHGFSDASFYGWCATKIEGLRNRRSLSTTRTWVN